MVCLKNIRKVCCRLVKYTGLLLLCLTAIAFTSLLSQHILLSRDSTSSKAGGVPRMLSLSLTTLVPRVDKLEIKKSKESAWSINKDNSTRKYVDLTHHDKHVVLKNERKLANEDGEVHAETDGELLKKFNVTPDAKWLRKFYKVDNGNKRRSLFDFPFIINGSDVCSKIREPFLVIMVLSVHTHIDTREAIRKTWGRAANPGVWPKIGNLQDKVRLVFLFGKGKSSLKNLIVRDESKTHKDIVQADFVDSYFNLSYKVVTGIRWVSKFCPGAKYILKADEDVFVHVHNLIEMLKTSPKTKQPIFYGHTHEDAQVLREGRWEVSPKSFPFPIYPHYTCGNTYIVPGSKAMEIYNVARQLDYMNIEDVFVTGILRTMIGAGVQDVVGFTYWYEKKPKPCEFKNTIRISATRVSEDLQYDIWEGLKTNMVNCYKITKKKPKLVRPEIVVQYKPLIRDEHIYFNKTSKQFYSVG